MKALLKGGIVIRFETTQGEPCEPLARVILEIPRYLFSKEEEEKLKSHPEIVNIEFREDIRDLIKRNSDFYTVDVKIKSFSIHISDMLRKAADVIMGALHVEKIE